MHTINILLRNIIVGKRIILFPYLFILNLEFLLRITKIYYNKSNKYNII